MTTLHIEAALNSAKAYTVCATFDESDVGAAIATLEIALQVARNNAPIYLRGGDIEMFKLCMAHMQEFEVGLNALRLREVGVFDSVNMDVLRDKGFQSWLSGVQNKLHADNEERNSHRSRVSGKAKSADLADLNKTAKDIDEATFVLAFLAAGSTVKDALFSEAMSIKNSYLSKTKKEEFATIGSRESKLELMRLLELSASKLYRRYQKSLDSSEASDTSDEFSDDKPLSPIERLDIIKQVLACKASLQAESDPLKKIAALKEIMALRSRLVGDVAPVDVAKPLNSLNAPNDAQAVAYDVAALLGDNATDGQKAVADRILIYRAAKPARGHAYNADYAVRGKYGDGAGDFTASFNETTANAQRVVSDGLRVYVDESRLKAMQDEAAGIDKALTGAQNGLLYSSASKKFPELAASLRASFDEAMVQTGYKANNDEFETLKNRWLEIIEARRDGAYKGEDAGLELAGIRARIDVLDKERLALRKKTMAQYKAALPKVKEYAALKDELNRIWVEMAGGGDKIIAAVHAASPVTVEQSNAWAKFNVTVHANARARLKRDKYQGDIDQDIEEFYRLTGGKLNKVEIITNGARRAHTTGVFANSNAQIFIDSNFDKRTLFHELGHNLEFDPKASLLAQAFLKRRRESSKLHKLRDLTGNRGYGASEVAFKDSWHSPYVGRFYEHGTTEVFAMGVQEFSSPARAQAFMQKDPEHFDMIVGYLAQKYDDLSQFNFDLGKAQLVEEQAAIAESEVRTEAAKKKWATPLEGFVFDATNVADFMQAHPDHFKKATFPVDLRPSNAVKSKPFEFLGFSVLSDNGAEYVTASISKGSFKYAGAGVKEEYVALMSSYLTSGGAPSFTSSWKRGFVALSDAQHYLNQQKEARK